MSYFSYYNPFSEFEGGAGVLDDELFTEDEQQSFLPRDDISSIIDGKPISPLAPYNILQFEDIRVLLGLILFVLAITSAPLVGLCLIGLAAIVLPLPCLVLAYCLSMQAIYSSYNKTLGMAIICSLMAILAITLTHITCSYHVTVISYIILGVLFCMYVFRLSYFSTPQACPLMRAGRKTSFSASFSDT
ncbi:imv membrane protein [Pteropox virus]|uniref:Imv membrane protein n=1 Tax=Pteropox virus TaxID=1873698 RepID=A0A1B1MRF6_9POXV|nr:imv membrane protein [Pteropox virus]ANS71196.1 imv membrane protein [Pteropox virus]